MYNYNTPWDEYKPKNKTELNPDGTPIKKEETKPEEFTIPSEELEEAPAGGGTGGGDEKGFEVKPGMYDNIAPTDGGTGGGDEKGDGQAADDAGVSTGVLVEPLNVKPITPAISGDLNETEEQRQARMSQRQYEAAKSKYEEEHPWVMENDYSTMRNKYKNKKWSQIVNDVAAYREKIGKPMSYEEKMMMLSQNPGNTSKKEELREKRLAYWADALNQMGNVLAHFYNYGRAKAGSPAAQIQNNKTSYSERLMAADQAARQKGYNDYVNALAAGEKRRQSLLDMQAHLDMQMAQEKRRLANQMELKRMEWMSPKYKKELERLDLDLQDKKVQMELHELQRAFQMMKNEAAKDHAFEMFVRKNSGKTGGNKTTKPYTYNGIGYTNDYTAYKDAMIASGKQPMKREAWDKQKDKRKLLIDAGVTIHGAE